MTNKQFAVLQAMSTIKRSTEMDDFLNMVGLTPPEFVETLRSLAQDGFITKTGKGYAIAEKGKLALIVSSSLPHEKSFRFYSGIGQPLEISAANLKGFYEVVKTLPPGSLEFHVERGDFENWVKTAIKDEVLARELAVLRQKGLKGEALRQEINVALMSRFGEEVLSRKWDT